MTAVFFPSMHPALVSGSLPDWVKFLSPGMTVPDSTRWHRPQDLPMSDSECERFAGKIGEFLGQFRNPKELSALGQGSGGIPFFQDSAMAVRADLNTHLKTGGAKPASIADGQARLQAQMNLVLAWIVEERSIEFHGLSRELSGFQEAFAQSLGVEGEDKDPVVSGLITDGAWERVLKWRTLLPWFLAFLDPKDVLVVNDPELVEEWEEMGISIPGPVSGNSLFPDAAHEPSSEDLAQVSGLDLMGGSQAIMDLPWMERTVSVFFVDPQANGV